MRVREIMSTPVTTLDPSDNLAFAEELMNVERVRHLPVVEGDVLVGLLSHRDIAAASISTLSDPASEDDLELKRRAEVRRVMRGDVETARPDDDVVQAADMLLAHKIGCLPVIDERHHLIGILTESDFVRVAREMLMSRMAVGATAARKASVSKARGEVEMRGRLPRAGGSGTTLKSAASAGRAERATTTPSHKRGAPKPAAPATRAGKASRDSGGPTRELKRSEVGRTGLGGRTAAKRTRAR